MPLFILVTTSQLDFEFLRIICGIEFLSRRVFLV